LPQPAMKRGNECSYFSGISLRRVHLLLEK
jgi:hypothetical protein